MAHNNKYLKGGNKLTSTVARSSNVVFGATTANPLQNLEATLDLIDLQQDQGDALVVNQHVITPATSGALNLKTKWVRHVCTAAATNVVAIDVPIGASLVGASIIVETAMVLAGGGTTWTAAWTASTQSIGSGLLLPKNTKISALYNDNAQSPVVSGAVETITLTPDLGTIAVGGVLIVVAYYMEIDDLSDIG